LKPRDVTAYLRDIVSGAMKKWFESAGDARAMLRYYDMMAKTRELLALLLLAFAR